MTISEKRRLYNKRYYDAHPEKYKEQREKHREARNARNRERYHTEPEYMARAKADAKASRQKQGPYRRKSLTYHVSEATLETMHDAGCAICGADAFSSLGLKLDVDHDHRTGKVRGVLCHDCNLALACFHDNPFAIEKALQYILRGGIYE
jgi:hypothetical protein